MRLNRDLSRLESRTAAIKDEVERTARQILADVKAEGDSAVRRYAEKFDGFTGKDTLVSEGEIKTAESNIDGDFARILRRARDRITDFHTNQIGKSWGIYKDNGVMTGQIARPLGRVALYVPGGTAAYPSTVLMNAIPAALAGVEDLAIFTPAGRDGRIADVILAAASCCGISTIYKIGGAQAIAAAAYGTETIERADKIVGPGNIYVAAAKRLVYGDVDIDMVAGPSEVLIVTDGTANPKYVAADMLSQAEHDEMARAILVTTSEKIIEDTERELERQMAYMERGEIIRRSLENNGAAILVRDLDEAFRISNGAAPEHLEIMTENPLEHLPKVRNAGSIFLGENTPEPLGDYMGGTNHVLPTGGTARFFSPLGVYDFVKFSSYSYYPREALMELKDDVVKFAKSEGLHAHANSISVRFE